MFHTSLKLPGRLAMAVAVPLLLSACASQPTYDGQREQSQIVVDNTSNAISDATIYLVPENGVRQRLGTVNLGQRQTFELAAPPAYGHYLLLDVPGNDDVRSQEFTFAAGDTVEWDLALNTINFVGSGGGR